MKTDGPPDFADVDPQFIIRQIMLELDEERKTLKDGSKFATFARKQQTAVIRQTQATLYNLDNDTRDDLSRIMSNVIPEEVSFNGLVTRKGRVRRPGHLSGLIKFVSEFSIPPECL